jgi:phosphate transport system substrate-binding protein
MPTHRRFVHRPLARAALLLVLTGCDNARPARDDSTGTASSSADRATPAATRVDLTGSGATFPYPLYARWFNEYAQQRGVRINYRSEGSAAGISGVIAHTVDFGATDVPMDDAELARAGTEVAHIPTAIGAVALTYHLDGLTAPLRLDAATIAGIFLGHITRWDDARLAALNPQASLPSLPIRVVHRTDGSGTSYIFSDYLSAVSTEWVRGPGRGRSIVWPVGDGGEGNEGVAGAVKQTVGTVGYVEVVYARQNRLPVVHIRNREGTFVSPMPFEIASAAAAVLDGDLTRDLRISLVNAPGRQSYPIASFTWMLVAPQSIGAAKTRQLADFLRWALLEGADLASTLGYVPLPSALATNVAEGLDRLAPPASR